MSSTDRYIETPQEPQEAATGPFEVSQPESWFFMWSRQEETYGDLNVGVIPQASTLDGTTPTPTIVSTILLFRIINAQLEYSPTVMMLSETMREAPRERIPLRHYQTPLSPLPSSRLALPPPQTPQENPRQPQSRTPGQSAPQ